WIKSQLVKYGLNEKLWGEKVGQVGDQVWGLILRQTALPVVDTLWMEHLTTMDDMREGVGLQAYGQKDPLVIYRQEGRELFERLVGQIWATIAERLERVNIEVKDKLPSPTPAVPLGNLELKHQVSDLGVADEVAALAEGRTRRPPTKPTTVTKDAKVGRNDPCPCGSGKKYKKCCGK
ncbi:MAG: SEC-C metal-binding domain-containing protein, partial [bacterium]